MSTRQLQSTIFCIAYCFLCLAQPSYQNVVKAFQDSLTQLQLDSSTTQLLKEERASFEGLNFFPVNDKFKVKATLERDHDPHVFVLTYSNDPNVPKYVSYGTLNFTLEGKDYSLHIYQNTEWLNDDKYKNIAFLPFKDWTNGPESYGGGRFMHISIPKEGNELIVDFNLSFNPPCAYNYYMACPLIPDSNQIETEITAGIMTY